MSLKSVANNSASVTNESGPTSFTLHVTNLPLEIEKDGVRNLFLDYGEVIGIAVFKARNYTNQAYISFSKYEEAENAIKSLNQQLPLMLNVRFKNDHKIEKPVINLSSPIVDFRYTENIYDNTQGGKKVIDSGKINCTPPAFQQKNYTSEDELLYPVPNDTATFNPYESPEPFHNTNLMYTRGTTHISKDGRRHVSFGRGYTYYNLPEPHSDIAVYLQNVYEKREKGLYEYATEEVGDDTGLCNICTSPTPYKCQKCGIAYYCSKPCQISDWAKHKLECQPIPPLVKRLLPNKAAAQNGHALESNVKEIEAQGTQLRRPKAIPPQTQQQSTVSTELQQTPSPSISPNKDAKFSRDNFRPKLTSPVSVNQESNNFRPKSPALSVKSSNNHQKSYESHNNLNKQLSTPNNFKAVATSFSIKPQPQKQKIEPKTCDDNIGFQLHTFIPKDKFVKVRITMALENGDYCVQKCDDDDAIEKLFLDLQSYARSTKRISPEENVKCILENDGMWYRATIVTLDQISKIFYHDWGTFDDLAVREVCPINGFEDRPLLCRQIRLVEGTDASCKGLAIDGEIFVKALNVLTDGTIVVQARSTNESPVNTTQLTEKMANCNIKQIVNASVSQSKPISQLTDFEKILDKIKSMPNVLDGLKGGEKGFLLLNKEIQGEHSMTLLPESQMEDFESIVSVLKEMCDKLAEQNPNFIPNVGDFVCGSNEDGEWLRGVVLRTTPEIKLAAVDESRIINPANCTPIPKEFLNICTYGVIGKFLPNTQMPDSTPSDVEFSVDSVSKESTMISVKHNELKVNGKAVLFKWIPKPEEKGILYAPLCNGNEVVLTFVFSQNLLYVRNMEGVEKERVHKLDQDIAKYALNRKPLTALPVVGQIVLAHFFMDDNYYRAIVTAVEDNKVKIKYLDYGNDEENININKLFDLPEDLKEQSSGVRKIKLKGVPENAPMTQEAKDFFDQLIGEVAILKCNFSGDPLTDGVILKTEKNENVNDIVTGYLKPTWDKGVEDNKKVYTFADLPEPKLGDVGDQVEAIPVWHYIENGTIVFSPNDVVAIEAINDLGQIISNYVEKTTDHYIPRNAELCIAKYDGQFYRAVCMDSNASPNSSRVLFMDYGNMEIVAHTDIRLFTEDFTGLAPLGILCNVSPMVPPEKFTDKVAQRIKDLVKLNELVSIKIISVEQDYTANIDIPSVRVQLTEEGLL